MAESHPNLRDTRWQPVLTEEQRREIVARYRTGEKASVIAGDYGICPGTVYHWLRSIDKPRRRRPPPCYDPSRVSALNAAWAAGLFDGEGCVLVRLRRATSAKPGGFYLHIQVSNSHLETLLHFQSIFGCGYLHRNRKVEGRLQTYCWVHSARGAEFVLRLLYPCSITKKEQIALALEFRGLGQRRSWHPVPAEHYEKGAEIALRLSALKGRAAKLKLPPPPHET